MIELDFENTTTDELLEVCKVLEDFLKFLKLEEETTRKVLDEEQNS